MAYEIEKQFSIFDLPLIREPEDYSGSLPEIINQILRTGGNTNKHRIEIAAEFSKNKVDSQAEFLKDIYHGGDGIDSSCIWYADDGIKISSSDSARWSKTCETVSWEEAAERIRDLLSAGQFATQEELQEYPHFERQKIAEKLWYLVSDFNGKAIERNLMSFIQDLHGGFPAEVAVITEALQDPSNLIREYTTFMNLWEAGHQLLRFNYHKPRKIYSALVDLGINRIKYNSSISEIPECKRFITQDEIDCSLENGSGIEGGKNRIYEFYQKPHSMNDNLHFLQKEYGVGGRSHALSGSPGSEESHDGTGMILRKTGCPEIRMSWAAVSNRISWLVKTGRYKI